MILRRRPREGRFNVSRWRRGVLTMGVIAFACGSPTARTPSTLAATTVAIPTWDQVSASGAPPLVGQGAMKVSYDAATGQLLAFDTGPAVCNDPHPTWEWDGGSWSQLPATSPVPGLTDPVMAYDADSKQLLLFGGYQFPCDGPGRGAYVAATWSWNGANWTELHPASSPPPGSAGCAGYDAVSKQVVVYGLVDVDGVTVIQDPNTWTWDGSSWTPHLVSPAPVTPSIDCQMAFDPVSGGVLLTVTEVPGLGGIETWLWDGASWTQRPASGPPAASSTGPTMAYDQVLGRVILYYGSPPCTLGPCTQSGPTSQTWEWTGVSWTPDTPATAPQARSNASIGYDDGTGQLVLFDGYTGLAAPWVTDTWVYAIPSGSAVVPNRISGPDRDATAVQLSRASFGPAGASSGVTAEAAVLARDDSFADALVGGPLAVAKHGPLLLTPSTGLASATSAELSRILQPGSTVYLLGGTSALSAAIETQVSALGFTVVRLWGTDRYATAVAVADALGDPSTVLEASGASYPDAVSAAPAAVAAGGAIMLTAGSSQSPSTADYLSAHDGGVHYAIGGPAARADPSAIAIVGSDRYATNAAVDRVFFPTASTFAVATGANFPDALSAGAFCGNRGGMPLLLVPPTGALPEATDAYLRTHDLSVTEDDVVGGSSAISDSVVAEVAAAITNH